MHLLLRYANRKLYDTASAEYVNLATIAGWVREGHQIQVMDRARNQNVTVETLAHALLADVKAGRDYQPEAIAGLIRAGAVGS